MKHLFYLTIVLFAGLMTKATAQDTSIFPLGEKAANINHTGDVWLRELNPADEDVDNQITVAVFAPNAKLNWHSHSGGQILLITEGTGYYQEKGKPAQVLHKGEVVKCLPDVEHWHGSAPYEGVTYLAVSPKSKTTWLNPVTEEEYRHVEPAQQRASNLEQELIQLSKDKWQWMADKDVDKLADLFDERSVFVHMGGSWGKERELQVIESGGIHYKKADVHKVSVEIINNTAILLNNITLLAVVAGNEVTNPFIVTEVYVKKNGQWKMGSLSFTRTMLPPPAAGN